LLATPLTVTLTGPVVAEAGTAAVICVLFQFEIVPPYPLKVTLLDPWVAPKPVPLICTCVPTPPLDGEMLVICGAGTV